MRVQEFARAQRALDDAHAVAVATRQHAYSSEHSRLQAELLAATGHPADAERNYLDAVSTARAQGARWLELRAARGFANFLAGAGRIDEARQALQPIMAQLTEGHETLDYAYANALLKTVE